MAQNSPWVPPRASPGLPGSSGQPAAADTTNNHQGNKTNNNRNNNKPRRNNQRGQGQQSHYKTQRQQNHLNQEWQALQSYAAALGWYPSKGKGKGKGVEKGEGKGIWGPPLWIAKGGNDYQPPAPQQQRKQDTPPVIIKENGVQAMMLDNRGNNVPILWI